MELNQQAGRSGLVVDDNRINRRVASAMLNRLGFTHIVEAENGQEALAWIKSSSFDLILMDCEMPVMDGFESTRQIRLWESESSKPASLIIAITARELEGDRERCLQAGMNDYLTKPLHIETLQGIMQNRDKENVPVSASMERDDISIIDEPRYEKMCVLLRDGVHDFYQDYLLATREKLDDIQSRLDMPVETSTRLIHSIRGSAANVGAGKLHELARLLEERLEAGETSVLHEEVSSLYECLNQLESQIQVRLG